MIYLACFAASAVFAYAAKKARSRAAFFMFSVFSIAVTVILAGLRDFSIGIDVENYFKYPMYWDGALNAENLGEYFKIYIDYEFIEFLFALLIGVLAQYTGDYRLFLFICHAIIITFVYIGAFRQRKLIDPVLFLLLFYLFFYNHSLNIIRQYIAMAIIFAFLRDVLDRKYLRYTIVIIIAFFVHTSAIIGFGALLLHWGLYGDFHKLNLPMRQRKVFLPMLVFIVVVVFPLVCQLLIDTGVLAGKYVWYFDKVSTKPTVIVSLLVVIELVFIYLLRKPLRSKYPLFHFFVASSIAYLAMHQLSWFMDYGKRVAAYFSFTNLITICMLENAFESKTNRLIARGLIVCVALAYWWYMYVLRNANETIPYVFGILNS